jgi:hypothetical protein
MLSKMISSLSVRQSIYYTLKTTLSQTQLYSSNSSYTVHFILYYTLKKVSIYNQNGLLHIFVTVITYDQFKKKLIAIWNP